MVFNTSLVALSLAEAHELFRALGTKLIDLGAEETLDTAQVQAIGQQLVTQSFHGPGALSSTVRHLGAELPALLPENRRVDRARRSTEIQGALVDGYLDALRTHLLQSQEQIKKAALRAQVQAERERAQSQAQFAAVFATADVGIAVGDIDGNIVHANRALELLVHRDRGGLDGVPFHDLAAEHDVHRVQDGFTRLKRGELPRFRTQIELRNADEDEPVSARFALTLVADSTYGPSYPVLVISDVTDLHLLQERIGYQSVHDALTGLPNKSRFVSHLETALDAATKTGRQIGLCFLDIDGFKVIQDGLGAQVGDQVLQSVANRLSWVFSNRDALVARMTGDGFAVVFSGPEVSAPILTQLVNEALRELAEPVYFEDQGVAISASVAIAVQPASQYTATELIRAAEITLHRAKFNGKAQWMLFDPELDAGDRARYRIGSGIGGALENGELTLDFAPLMRLDTPSVPYAVAGIPRWDHAELGVLREAEFSPLAVETGLMLPIGHWLLERGCAQVAEWRAAGDMLVPVRLRVPDRMMLDEDLVNDVTSTVERLAVDPESVQIQFAPEAVLTPRGELNDSLQILHESGFGLTLEIAGTAELSMARRHRLPLSGVHLTGDLVEEVSEADDDDFPLRELTHLVGQASLLGLVVTAEAVPDADCAARLGKLGVLAASGMFAAPPGTARDVLSFLRGTAKSL